MAQFSHNFLTVAKDPEMKTVGRNNTSLTELLLVETHQRKRGNEYEVTGKTWWNANVWGDKAFEASQLKKGDVLDLSAEIVNDKIKFKAITDDNSYTTKDGEEISKTILVIFDFDVREFDNE